MKKLMFLLIPLIIFVGCKSFEDLEAGNKIALENQDNLEKNTMRSFENYKKILKLYGETVGGEEAEKVEAKLKTVEAQQTETAEELAIIRAWLLVLGEAIKKDSLNADLLGSVVTDLPGWIKEGKTVYDLIKSKTEK